MPKKKTKQNKLTDKYPLIAIPAILFLILFFLTVADLFYKSLIFLNQTKPQIINFQNTLYPILSNNNLPILTANGAIVMDSENKKIIFQKNMDVRFSPASTTKIMTALTALQYFKPDDILTVDGSNIDSEVGLKPGQRFTFTTLLYAMMLPSDNKAAETIASNYKGGEKAFIKQMNQNAKSWSLKNTYFSDPVGLLDDSDYTTPFDLALLSSIAMENPTIRKVVATKETTVSDVDEASVYDLQNLNILLGTDGVVGLKTGHTDEAKDVLVTAKNEQGHLLIIVVMNSDNRFPDTLNILNFIDGKITFLPIRLK